MSTPALERFLAKLYVDAKARARFLASPAAEAARAGLTADQCRALEKIDRAGLELAARSLTLETIPNRRAIDLGEATART